MSHQEALPNCGAAASPHRHGQGQGLGLWIGLGLHTSPVPRSPATMEREGRRYQPASLPPPPPGSVGAFPLRQGKGRQAPCASCCGDPRPRKLFHAARLSLPQLAGLCQAYCVIPPSTHGAEATQGLAQLAQPEEASQLLKQAVLGLTGHCHHLAS